MTYIVDRTVYKNSNVTISKRLPPVYGSPLVVDNQFPLAQFSRIYNNLMAYLKTAKLNFELTSDEWQMVMRINYLDEETKMTVSILNGCIKRNQSVYLSDFSFLEHYIILMKFIYKLSESFDPLIPQEALVGTEVDYDNVEELNTLFNDILIYQNAKRIAGEVTDGQYDNSYIIIKVFKFFHALLEKLNDEVHLFEDYTKHPETVRRRQILRLILAYTKVLFDDNPEINDPDEVGFDNLFKFVHAVMRHYNKIRVFGTDSGMEEFNNYITVSDFLAFESFKSNVLNALLKGEEEASKEEDTLFIKELPRLPTRPIIPSHNHSSRRPPPPSSPTVIQPTPAVPTTALSEVILLPENFRVSLKTRKPIRRENSKKNKSLPRRWINELVKPSDQLTSELIKYTEKDLIVQKERSKPSSNDLSTATKTIKGRKVSLLARIYEEKLFGENYIY
ncbi:hypothetical protein FOA43_000878 [Brettanomyces nanus]|uniref:Uncharacterized protein n=1 Tax=Eeniella nana TaxID=13502 RepID=A0A875RX39_EENNA|nr:uncharacterized protein FOA43_000878 [Brettanomyces nanus]QPG73566.1 hypothetical protein FOA43_000878 [Brettanomyces nanus]